LSVSWVERSEAKPNKHLKLRATGLE